MEITTDLLKQLVGSRGMVVRAEQRVPFQEAMDAVKVIGEFLAPGFQIDEHNRFAYENAVRWCINDPAMKCNAFEGPVIPADAQKGLYIFGNVGTGKSLLLDVCRLLCKIYRIGVKSGDEPTPLAWTTGRADDICDQIAADGDLKIWKDYPVLCIQDLGNEPPEVLYMGNRRRVMRSVLEARGDMYDRLTLISSNIRPEKLGEFYGARVASRIKQMCNAILMGGPDRRK